MIHNNTKSRVTKFKPIDIFFNNNNLNEIIKSNIVSSQKKINESKKFITIDSKVLISSVFNKNGKKISVKYNKKGNKVIPGIVIGLGSGSDYPVRISIDYKELKKDYVYDIDYRLIKEISDTVYQNILKNGIEEDLIEEEVSDVSSFEEI